MRQENDSGGVLFLIKSKFDSSNFKETHFAQNVTVTQKDKSTIFKSSVHCALVYNTWNTYLAYTFIILVVVVLYCMF